MNNNYKPNDEQNMNESHFDTVMKRYQDVRMNPEEKREVFKQTMLVIEKIEAVSLAHSDLHKATRPTSAFVEDESLMPMRAGSGSGHGGQNGRNQKGVRGMAIAWISYIKQRQFIPALLTAFAFLFTGGTSVMAERSLPGESLYSFKININEPIRELTAVGSEAKARLAVETTEKRLQEAAILSSQGKLDESNKKIIQDQFSKSATEVRNQVAALVSSNDLPAAQEISENYEITLWAHGATLLTLAGDSDSKTDSKTDAATGTPETALAGGATNDDASSTPLEPVETVAVHINTASSGEPVTPLNPIAIVADIATATLAVAPASSAAANAPVNSLLQAVRAEIDTTKTARISIEAEANAAISKSSDQSTSSKAIVDAMIQGIRFSMDDISKELDAHKYDPKAFAFAANTVSFAKTRMDHASSSIAEMSALSKEGSYVEAIRKGRATSRSLSEVLIVLKIEKTTKGSLDGKINVTSLIQSAESGDASSSSGAAGL
jgi:hypothetical protein